MSLLQVKSYVTIRYAEHITRFKGVSNEQIVKSYSFDYELMKTTNRLIEKIASSKGVTAIVGKRGVGKTHMLSVVRSLANQPSLVVAIADLEARSSLQKHALLKIPDSGVASLTLGFDLEKGLDFIKVFPMGSVQTTSLRGWVSAEQVLNVVNNGIEKFGHYVLFVDGLCPALKHPEKSQYAKEWLLALAEIANQGHFGLITTLDEDIEDIFDSNSHWSIVCQKEKIELDNLSIVVEQKLFRKTPEQRLALGHLYEEIKKAMPHFSSEKENFINLYPGHSAILQVSPAMYRYVKGFSLLNFLIEQSNTALIRKDTSLINLSDLFEEVEDELRKHPYLKEIFGIYDNWLYYSAVHLDTQKALYAKLLLRSLLILSLVGRGATLEEMANGVMLNDERDSKNFLKQLEVIMSSLIEIDPRIGVIDFGTPRYIFCDLFEMEPFNTEQLNPTNLGSEQIALINSSSDDIGSVSTASKKLSFLDTIHEHAELIRDDDKRLYELLLLVGRKFFKDWPFITDNTGTFRDRAEINIRWCGSLRKGVFKLGGEAEILSQIDQENSPVNEYDWQMTIMLPYQGSIPELADPPKTLLYWQGAEFSKEDWLILKYLVIARSDIVQSFDPEEVNKYIAAFETNVVDLFGLAYLEGGKILNLYQESWPLNYHSSSFISIILARLLDKPLSLRYPEHPRFEDLLDPDYLDEISSWMFSFNAKPSPDQQVYLEQFARPLGLVRLEGEKYVLDVVGKTFAPSTPVGSFLQLLEQLGEKPLTKTQAYKALRKEPFGLQRPALIVILSALAASKKISLVDDANNPIHNEWGLKPDIDVADFSAIYSVVKPKAKVSFWGNKKEATPSVSVFSNQTIMLVEDEPDILTCIELAVEPLGCKVKTAINGLEALKQLLLDSKIDLVISDLMMPGMDGVQLFHEMQTNPELRDIPFIVLSSIDAEEDIAKALENGVTDYWTKPFSIIELTARIKKFLRRRLATTDAYSITAWPNEKSPESAPFAPSEFKSGEMKSLSPAKAITAKEPSNSVSMTFFEMGVDFDSQKLYDQFADIYLRNGNMSEIPEYEDFEAQLLVKLNKLKKQFRCNNFILYVEVKDNKSQVFCQLHRSTEYLAKEPKFLLM